MDTEQEGKEDETMAPEMTAACTDTPSQLTAVQWQSSYYSRTWVHGALADPARVYGTPRRTLCGKRVGDASTVPGGAAAVTCRSCRRKLGLSGRGY